MQYSILNAENSLPSTEELVELYDAVGDGQTIAYVQDLLVHPQAQRHGIGSALLGKIIADFDREGIRQRFITTDIVDTPVIELYRRFGFTPVQDNGCVTLAKYVF